jgi:circadian clock protein KaiC
MRLSSGIAALDMILGGGFESGSLVVIAGPPGSGKTILAQQIAFANATEDAHAVYYTTLSEPHTKLIRHLEPFSFFDAGALGRTIHFNHLHNEGDERGFRAAAGEVVRQSFQSRPRVIVIDSIRALRSEADDGLFREQVYEFATLVSHTDALLVFVGEYLPHEIGVEPEFAVADGIVYLTNETLGSFDRRMLHVLKLRGSNYFEGQHRFKITGDGLDVFPRLEALPVGEARESVGRVTTGIDKLDPMIGGGLPTTSATLVSGPSGVGKTCMGLTFIMGGLMNGERAAYVTLQESEPQLIAKARGFGWDLASYRDSGKLQILYLQPGELSLDQSAGLIRQMLGRLQPARVVIDSLSELELAATRLNRWGDFVWALVENIRRAGATSLLTNETAAFFGPAFELAGGYSYVFDNIVLLRYTEVQSAIHRALAVVKMRESAHSKDLVDFDITTRGIAITGDFTGFTGILSGTPVPTERKFKEFFSR